jgi:hypothetical protein
MWQYSRLLVNATVAGVVKRAVLTFDKASSAGLMG